MKNLGYYNGRFGPLEEMTVPFNDRVHFFGDGIYDATCARNGVIFALDEHLDRFFRNASLLDLRLPCAKAELRDILYDLLPRVDGNDLFVCFQATRGTAPRAHAYPDDMRANLWISLSSPGLKDIRRPIRAVTAEDLRFLLCHIKTLNLLPAVLYARKAAQAGVYETILYRKPDRVTECSHSNVHIINRDGVFQTAPADHLILAGIARAHLLNACRALGVAVSETPFTLDELMGAKEVMTSSSSAPCMHCVEIDGKPVGGGAPDVVRALQDYVLDEFMRETAV